MTVSSIIPVNNYVGNGSTTVFDFDFLIESAEELLVTYTSEKKVSTILQYGIDYSIYEIGNVNGSHIIFPLQESSFNILKNNETLSLALNLEIKQESKFENSSNLNLMVLEWTFDYVVRILQMLSRKVERCVKTKEGSNLSPDEMIEEISTFYKKSLENANIAEQCAQEARAVVEENISWGNIYGNIVNQSDLNTALNSKAEITLCNEIVNDKIDQSFAVGVCDVGSNERVFDRILNYYNSASSTGEDIINGANYSVYGNPVIGNSILDTASGYNVNNYINNMTDINLKDADTEGINILFEYELNSVSDKYLFDIRAKNETGSELIFGLSADAKLYVQILKNSTLQGQGNFTSVLGIGIKYKIFFTGKNGTWTVKLYTMQEGTYILSETITFSAVYPFSDNLSEVVWNYENIANYKFYLNSLKIEENNQLVFSPYLSVKYVLSKTGSKIADVYYRSIIKQVYNKNGYAGYYTIDKENENYTLPMGEIFGIIQKTDEKLQDALKIVEIYKSENGTAGYYLYNNGWCVQWGYVNMTTTTAANVTFFKGFRDSNYQLALTAEFDGDFTSTAWIRTKTNYSVVIGAQRWQNANVTGVVTGAYYTASGYVN